MLRLIPPYPPAEVRNVSGTADNVGTVGYFWLGSIRYGEAEGAATEEAATLPLRPGLGCSSGPRSGGWGWGWGWGREWRRVPAPARARGLIGTHGSAWRAYHANSMYPNFDLVADAPDSAKWLLWKKAAICARGGGGGGGAGREGGEGGDMLCCAWRRGWPDGPIGYGCLVYMQGSEGIRVE